MKGHRHIAWLCYLIVICLLIVQPIAWGAEPKPGGTLRVAWEADATVTLHWRCGPVQSIESQPFGIFGASVRVEPM